MTYKSAKGVIVSRSNAACKIYEDLKKGNELLRDSPH